ncbi:hypothetical protein BU24DRAFT_405748 [Aaosphaeria arxii CBS 175.79]|uniref:Pal1-domain-containing protein n=1 Tax=Aaosphaeria arxii CBS 175.79 TaxID=1450172 RepID=A0A6A5Y192_9PLEO|nr:uncharacterized protein BU24DRAFT_405748 [Aaosphaeria arxii CBS 175.79]KAF2019029.1 hypothetical protein BU24DRAFT_405748 [Aaosphaeria arxii CBS 175.79]
MPIRNPFRRAGGVEVIDENQRPSADRGFQNTAVNGTNPVQIKEPTEYKLSEINDSGVYLPPSPTTEKPAFWHSKSNASTTSSNHRSLLNENEPFNISRESFDSYRRSFDISARSPVIENDTFPRGSLDARRSLDTRRSLDVRRSRAPPRSSLQERRTEETPEEGFEDVGLNDEPKPQAKKRGLFARFGDNADAPHEDKDRPTSSHLHFNFTGRKRAQSGGQGSEMKPMNNKNAPLKPETAV